MRLGILLAASSEAARALRYAEAASRAGHHVELFVTGEAVAVLAGPLGASLCEAAAVTVCAQTLQRGGYRAPPAARLGTQFDHAELAHRVDRLLSLT